MRVLAVETSCDETAAAVVRFEHGEFRLESNVVASQVARHAEFGGVVPELATREHLAALETVVDAALRGTRGEGVGLDAVAATRGPGLAGALMMGHGFARTLATAWKLPFLGVNHMEGHLYSPFVPAVGGTAPAVPDEWLGLIVSGGHTLLMRARRDGRHERLGSTRDDAAGEAFDKGAKLLGLGYPGGPALERAARGGDPGAVAFPRARMADDPLAFSFSGLKTALRVHLAGRQPGDAELASVCASYQQAIVDVLVARTREAAAGTGLRTVGLAGGVACNGALRSALARACERDGLVLRVAEAELCTDNAAMIAAVACLRIGRGESSGPDEEVDPNLRLGVRVGA
jgi:N6-L-threonylcarbamoyladenine synthase